MHYNSLVKSEDTDIYFEAWEKYRINLTQYIIDSIESFYTKRYLAATGKKKIYEDYNIEKIVEELGKKPSLAIWGAGGCNDIDIWVLAKYFRLVLIDHNLEKIRFAKERFHLNDDECICVDLKFWDFPEENYLMVEALLKDGADNVDVENYIKEVVFKMPEIPYEDIPHFDFSVAIGIASQLNARFAALFHIYKYHRNMVDFLQELNRIAVDRFLNTFNRMTHNMFIVGFEERRIGDAICAVEDKHIEELNSMRITGDEDIFKMKTEVSGNEFLIEYLYNLIETEYIEVFTRKNLLWNFMSEKNYIMDIISFELK